VLALARLASNLFGAGRPNMTGGPRASEQTAPAGQRRRRAVCGASSPSTPYRAICARNQRQAACRAEDGRGTAQSERAKEVCTCATWLRAQSAWGRRAGSTVAALVARTRPSFGSARGVRPRRRVAVNLVEAEAAAAAQSERTQAGLSFRARRQRSLARIM